MRVPQPPPSPPPGPWAQRPQGSGPWAPAHPARPASPRHATPRPPQRRALLLVLVLALLLGGTYLADSALALGRIRPGTTVGGISVGGLTPVAARARLAAAAPEIERRPLLVQADTATLSVPRERTGVRLDVTATVAAVERAASTRFLHPGRLLGFAAGKRDLPWHVRVDQPRLDAFLNQLEQRVRRPAREPALRVTNAQAQLVPGQPGRAVDRAAAAAALQRAAADPAAERVAVPVVERAPSVTPQAAQAALAKVQALLAGPVTVQHGGQQAQLQPRELAPLVRSAARGGTLRVALDPAGLDQLLRARAAFAYAAPQDATFRVSGGQVTLVPAVTGRAVDAARAAAAVLAAGQRPGRRVSLPVRPVAPKLTTDAARKLGVRERVSTFTTTFSAEDRARVTNIRLIGEAIDGTLVKPGETFSMNAATGERTAAKGYQTANVIVRGELVPGLGGGVCQAGTTVFNALFFGGFKITQRHNHSLHISHYPLGRDATLNWPDKDLKFVNDTPYGILIKATVTSSSMTVDLYSTSMGYQVRYTTSGKTNFRPPPTRFKDDPNLPAGATRVEEPGAPGFDVTVTRTVTRGGRVVRQDTFTSRYSPWTRVVVRGTGRARA